jgi:hypothetical protein
LTMHSSRGRMRNEQYSLLTVMSELSTVRCDRVLGLWLQVHERQVSTESFRGGAQAGRQLWRVSWFAPQNQVCGRRLKTPSRGDTGVGLGTGGGDGRRRRLGPRRERGGDGRREASRAIRRPRRERHPGPQRGDGNLPARGVLAVFSKPATYPGFRGPSKTADRIFIDEAGIAEKALSRRKKLRHRIRSCTGFCSPPTGLTGP